MRPGRVLLFGLIGLVIAQVIAYWQQSASPLLASALTVAAGSIPLFIDFAKERERSGHATGPVAPDAARDKGGRAVRPPGHKAGFGALLVGLAALVAVGGALAWGVSYVVGIFTGTEQSVQRLAQPVTGRAGALTLRIDEVAVGRHTTQVLVTATNRADYPVTIPLFDNCQLLEKGRPAIEAQTGFTISVVDVPPGSVPVTKQLVFSSTPSAEKTTLTLTCSRLYWQGFGQPGSLQVKGIMLTG